MMLIDLRVYRYSTDSRLISLAGLRSGLIINEFNIKKFSLLYFCRLWMIAPFMDDTN